jgi:hypothetical protein
MYGQKVVRKGVQKAPRNPKSPVKQANPRLRIGQKRVKNGPQKRHQNPTQKSTKLKSTKIDEKPQNRRKSPKTTSGGLFGPKKTPSGVHFDGPTIAKQTHLGEQNA